MNTIQSTKEFETILKHENAVLAYFSHEKCSVCKTLKPKIIEVFKSRFPKFNLNYININELPKLAATNSVFTVPVVIIYFEGKETFRKGRAFGIEEIINLVERPYNLIFD